MYWIPDCLSVELGFWITIVSGIPYSFSCITDSKVQDYRCASKNFLDSGIPYLMVLTAGQKPATSSQTHTTESQLAAALNIQIMDLACITWSLFHGTRGMNAHRVNLGHKWA